MGEESRRLRRKGLLGVRQPWRKAGKHSSPSGWNQASLPFSETVYGGIKRLNGGGKRENSREVPLRFRAHSRRKPGLASPPESESFAGCLNGLVPVQRKNLNKSDIFLLGYHSLLIETLSIQRRARSSVTSFGDSWSGLAPPGKPFDRFIKLPTFCGREIAHLQRLKPGISSV